MNAAIYFHPEAYTTNGPKLMGRNVAGESFIRGFFEHSKSNEFWIQVQSQEYIQIFSEIAHANNRFDPIHAFTQKNLGGLKQAGLIYYPGPGIGEHAFHRSFFGDNAWSLCGITHTISSARAMDAIVDLICSPVQPWDALICTSHAVKNSVEKLLQIQIDYLKERLGITKFVLPQLPVIPLGVHTKDFLFSDEEKQKARNFIGATDKSIVVLYVGRLSFHAKAHPLAMYQALELAALKTGKDIILVEFGIFPNEHIADAYAEAATQVCKSIKIVTLDGSEDANVQTAWAGADIFCSLSDNIQESFGITPIEAMAAGLPVIVSDWDGYKDTVRDGIDGYRISTTQPQSGVCGDLAYRHAMAIDTYDMYCGHTCSLVAVDIELACNAFVTLIESGEKRLMMGASGRKHAEEMYDWSVIIPQYESLWQELKQIRLQHTEIKHQIWPARPDPFYLFSQYSTNTVTFDTKLTIFNKDAYNYKDLKMVAFAKHIMPSEEEVESILKKVHIKTLFASEILEEVAEHRKIIVFRSLSWLIKLGVLKVVL